MTDPTRISIVAELRTSARSDRWTIGNRPWASSPIPKVRVLDFYRELADLFNVPMAIHNRWAGFKSLRSVWAEHISSSLTRPVLIVGETQEMVGVVFNELRILSSKEFDSQSLLCVVLAGDARLPERLRHSDLLPLGIRVRRRLALRLRDARRAARLPRPPARHRWQSFAHGHRAQSHPRRAPCRKTTAS